MGWKGGLAATRRSNYFEDNDVSRSHISTIGLLQENLWHDSIMDFIIVGAGQLGSRHGQALAKLKDIESITFLDPNPESLSKARARVREVSNGVRVELLTELTTFTDCFGAIISTSSNQRASGLNALLRWANPRFVLLEKLLASNSLQLEQIWEDVDLSGIPAFVNCPMPYFDHYLELQGELTSLQDDERLTYLVRSNLTGLASNSVHYLDHILRLTKSEEITKLEFDSSSRVVDSKRDGYSEIVGSMFAETNRGDDLLVDFNSKSVSPELIVRVTRGSLSHSFDELNGLWKIFRNGVVVANKTFHTPNQSELTNVSVERLMSGEPPFWTPIAESMKLHRKLVEALNGTFRDAAFT